jgi:hypothetical protein
MKRLLLVSLAAAAVAPGAMAYAGDFDPPPQTSPQQMMQSPVRSRETSRKEGNTMVAHDHEKKDLRDKKERTKNKGHKSEKNVTDAGQGVTLEEENMLLVASVADADAERGKSKMKKRKKKKEDIEPTQITFFTIPDDDFLFKFFLDATGEQDPIPIPANYTLPAGSYNFTYDNGSEIEHNFVVEVFASKRSKGKILAETVKCFECTNSTGIVKLKAHARVFFHCEPHESVPMGFNATIVKST